MFTNMEEEEEDMLLPSLDMVLKTESTTGSAKTHGVPIGEKEDTSESKWEKSESIPMPLEDIPYKVISLV